MSRRALPAYLYTSGPHLCDVRHISEELRGASAAAANLADSPAASLQQDATVGAPKCVGPFVSVAQHSAAQHRGRTHDLLTLLGPLDRNASTPGPGERGAASQRHTCRFFHSAGGCSNGARCKFAHDRSGAEATLLRSVAAGRLDVSFESSIDHLPTWLLSRIRSALISDGVLPDSLDDSTAPQHGGSALEISPPLALLLGDGDLGFAASLASHLPPGAVLATSVLPSEKVLFAVHPAAKAHKAALESRRCRVADAVAFSVDATRLPEAASRLSFDGIRFVVWNFPHNGLEGEWLIQGLSVLGLHGLILMFEKRSSRCLSNLAYLPLL